jgi:acetyltransferase-like isoleucine patch superfamily enzyme
MKGLASYILLIFKLPAFLGVKIYNFISLKAAAVSYSAYPVISGKLIIKGKGKIKLGNKVIINSSLSSNPVGLVCQSVLFAYEGATIEIGNRVGISNSLVCAMKKVTIEEGVLIGGGTQIFDNDFHSLKYKERMEPIDTNIKILPVVIKKGAFVGCNSIIGKGVIVGERSVIAAGSVVIKSIPDDELWGGNPARFIKVIDNNYDAK